MAAIDICTNNENLNLHMRTDLMNKIENYLNFRSFDFNERSRDVYIICSNNDFLHFKSIIHPLNSVFSLHSCNDEFLITRHYSFSFFIHIYNNIKCNKAFLTDDKQLFDMEIMCLCDVI